MLQIPSVQQEVARIAANKLREKTGSEIEIGAVEFQLFNKIVLKNLYLEDQAGDTLFYAHRLSAGFDFLPLLKGRLNFSSAQLFTFQMNLNKADDQSPLNIQYLIDAFASKDTIKKETNIDLNIHTLNIRKGTFTYHVKDAPETPGVFNAKHLDISDFSSKIYLHRLTGDSINAEISKLSLKERSGLEVKRLLFHVEGTKQMARIGNFELSLPYSHLQLNNITAEFPEDQLERDYLHQTRLSLDIVYSEISPRDLSSFAPVMINFRDKITLNGHLEGTFDRILVSGFQLTSANHLLLDANAVLNNISRSEEAYVEGEIRRFSISAEGVENLINNFSEAKTILPEPVGKLGKIGFTGYVSGYFRDLMANGNITTGSGSLKVNVNVGRSSGDLLFVKGTLETPSFDLHTLFPGNNPYGKIVFQANLDAKHDMHKKMSGKVNANVESFEYKNHTYNQIQLDGDFTHNSFKGNLNINDTYGKLTAEGSFNIDGSVSGFDFYARAEHLNLDKLNLLNKYKESDTSFEIDANVTGNDINSLQGYIALRNFNFQTPENHFTLDSLHIEASGTEDRLISLRSDLIWGELFGAYSYSQIIPAIQQTLHNYLPALVPLPDRPVEGENNFYLDLTIENTEKLSKAFALPVTILKQSTLKGQYNYRLGEFRVNASFPRYNAGGLKLEDTRLSLQNIKQQIFLDINGIRYGKFDVKTDVGVHLAVENNTIHSLLKWKNREDAVYEGEISASALFVLPDDEETPMNTEIELKRTHLTFNDTTWTVHPAKILINDKITIDHLNADHSDQFIRINGVISKDTADNLYVDLNKVNLGYIFDALTISNVDLGGIASGKAIVNDIYHTKKLNADLQVTDFSFNNAVFGDLKLDASWNNEKQGIVMIGNINKSDTVHIGVDGIIYPAEEKLSIYFDAKNANARFLRKYLDNVAPEFSGEITGKLHLYGGFKTITVDGNAYVRNGGFGIDFLNTYYTFNDSVYLTKDRISLKNTILRDRYGKMAVANGQVKHKFFKTFDFSANVQANKFLVFNASERNNPTFFGTAFGTGSVSLRGTEDEVNIDISLRTDEKTKMSLNFMNPTDVVDFDFIHFTPKDTLVAEQKAVKRENDEEQSKTNVKMNMVLETTPDAMVELYMDPVTGDKIKAWGKGKMQIQYGNKIDPKIYGNYIVERGTYHFSMQQVIFRDFHINEGSTVTFRGDPYGAILDLDAVYSLSANLGDLDNSFNIDPKTPMSTVIVNCLLNIAGELQHPAIKFDLKLPYSSSELERQVKSIISTEEMMNRQMIFLLALGRFYTQDQSTTNQGNNDFANVASSTLSSQLNSILGDLSNNFQIGTDIRTNNYEEYTDTEVKLLLSSQLLNHRLLINGNLGYKDNPSDQRSFVGDFDLEYKLTKAGDIRLKAYNHYNDKYYFVKSALTTQGVGILFRRDFDDLYDLFKIKRKPVPAITGNNASSGEADFILFKQ